MTKPRKRPITKEDLTPTQIKALKVIATAVGGAEHGVPFRTGEALRWMGLVERETIKIARAAYWRAGHNLVDRQTYRYGREEHRWYLSVEGMDVYDSIINPKETPAHG